MFEERYFWHRAGMDLGSHVEGDAQFETPEARRRLLNLLQRLGLADECARIRATDVGEADLLRVHTEAYVERIRSADETGGEAGEHTPFGPGSYGIACLSAGGAHAAVSAVLDGAVDVAYALVRPPGHHAEAGRGRGYCIFANIAVAIERARAELGLTRVAVIDWDVHHGNGTQSIYYHDPETLTISLHQDRLYPSDSGLVDEIGGEGAEGANINIPLPAGSGEGAYLHAWDSLVEPAVRDFAPELVVVGCGFDASAFDPGGRMLLMASSFRALTARALDLAERSGGRLVMVHEGGYSPIYVPICGAAVVETLLGVPARVVDSLAFLGNLPDQALQPHQEQAVCAAVRAHRAATATCEA